MCLYAEKGSYANSINMIILPPHRHIYANSLAPFVFIKTYTPPTIPPFALTKGLTLETLASKLFTGANLHYQLS